MNPLLTVFLFIMALLAIATACALLIYVYSELKRNKKALEAEKRHAAEVENEARQVSSLLIKMQASPLSTETLFDDSTGCDV